jgi:hypothetical protein
MRFAPQRPLYGSSCVLFSPSCILFALVASSSQSHSLEAEERERAAIAQRAAVVANWRSAIERLATEPADVVAALRAEAASFRGMRLTEDSQMFRQRLAQLAERHFSIKIGLSADRQ